MLSFLNAFNYLQHCPCSPNDDQNFTFTKCYTSINFLVINLYEVIFKSVGKPLSFSWLNKNYFIADPLDELMKHKPPENRESQLYLDQDIQKWAKKIFLKAVFYRLSIFEYVDAFDSIALFRISIVKINFFPILLQLIQRFVYAELLSYINYYPRNTF